MPNDDPPPPYSAVEIKPVTQIEGNIQESDLHLEAVFESAKNGTQKILVKIQPSHGIKRTPANICCVVDISGSMSDEATFMNDEGSRESDGLTILDIVKHAVKTILSTMTAEDQLSIVSFSTDARLDFPAMTMTPKGKAKALAVLEAMHTENSTNLWGGLELGLDTIRNAKAPGKINSVFLFTDGQPNVIPPRGHLPMIKQYKDKHSLPCSVNTFGFGYSLDSTLLDEIARECDGSYVFIPDSGLVGTAFINATANLYTVMAEDVTLRVEPGKGAGDLTWGVLGGHQIVDASWGKSIRVGNVRFNQSREFVLNLNRVKNKSGAMPKAIDEPGTQEPWTVYLDYTLVTSGSAAKKQREIQTGSETITPAYISRHISRNQFVDAVESCIKKADAEGRVSMAKHVKVIKASVLPPGGDAFISLLLEDVNGQVTEAFEPGYFLRWGRHYLYSLADAHRSQVCNNFKDPGVQGYGGPLFQALRDNFDEIFNTLPAPKPSRQGTRTGPVNMRLYNNFRGGCFHPKCLIQMSDGTSKMARHIHKGDRVVGLDTPEGSEVICVLRILIDGAKTELVAFENGLKISPYHPIYDRDTKSWKFPIDLKEPTLENSVAVYSFVLAPTNNDHSIIVNGVPCVTVGHNIQGDVREHPYFGSTLIIQDLRSNKGWEQGLIICNGMLRDPVTNLVCGLEFVE